MVAPLPAEAANRCRIEIRTTTTGIVYAPGTNGASSPYNPLLATNSVGGMGENAEVADSGLFCLSFADRPATGTRIFARIYDAPTAAEAAFYVDSALATVTSNGASLVLAFGEVQTDAHIAERDTFYDVDGNLQPMPALFSPGSTDRATRIEIERIG